MKINIEVDGIKYIVKTKIVESGNNYPMAVHLFIKGKTMAIWGTIEKRTTTRAMVICSALHGICEHINPSKLF